MRHKHAHRVLITSIAKIMHSEPNQTGRYIAWFAEGDRSEPVVRFYFQLSAIHSLAAQRLADFSIAFFQNAL